MRIISGEKKGMRLQGAKDATIRPTMDQAKESLFNIIGPLKGNEVILDLFGGTGAIGVEFISRGAQHAVIGELRRKNITIIQENVAKANYQDRISLVQGDFRKTLKMLYLKGYAFDYIFLDPPYDTNFGINALYEIEKYGILKSYGNIILETEKDVQISENSGFHLFDCRTYGRTKFCFFAQEEMG